MLHLNDISEERATYSRESTQRRLDRVLSDPPSPHSGASQSFHERAGRLRMELGLYSYALEYDDITVRRIFQQAARDLAPALTLRQPPEPGDNRSPWEAEQFLATVISFTGGTANLASLADLQPSQYRYPVQPAHDGLAQYLAILLQSLRTGDLDSEALGEVAERCERGSASRDERLYLLPAALGLQAVADEDEDVWNLQLARLLSAHKEDALHGDLQLLPAGLLSLRALMLAELGLDRGMACRADSIYLPLDLLSSDSEDETGDEPGSSTDQEPRS